MRTCEVCGENNRRVYNSKRFNMTLCDRHWYHMKAHGKILERTIKDPNEIVMHDDYAEIFLYDVKLNHIATALIDIEDVDKVKNLKWRMNKHGYVTTGIKSVGLHRIITKCPDDMVVDHISHDKLNNRKSNLRICSVAGNMCNIRKSSVNTSGVKGVYWNKRGQVWVSEIKHNGIRYYLGRSKDISEVITARKIAEEKYQGEFAYKEEEDIV